MEKNTDKNKNELPLYLFHQGTNYHAYDLLGAHFDEQNGSKGVVFRVWAPNADKVCLTGDFNNWDCVSCEMKRINEQGVFEVFVKGLKQYDTYKYAVYHDGNVVLKADPYAFHSETAPATASKIYNLDKYTWKDGEFVKNRKSPYDKPMNIYEVNLGSWKRHEDGNYFSYRELAKYLTKYVVEMGYTHVEFMPVAEYPFEGSWGYQITGYYAISSRFGTPDDFKYLVDKLHQHNISVIIDWVPAHFPKDIHGLYEFDGTCCYENQGWDRKEHKSWGTRIFDWGRNEVQSFLISNAMFMFDKFHIDGLRVDAVASMLYLDYDRKPGEWIPNEQGGNYNLEAIAFLKKLNTVIFESYPDALMIAEESTAFPMITKPADIGGLGFNFKWNMGWMNDSLSYMQTDPYFRSYNHDKLTFSMCYAFSENFVLPISHDEVVHGKKSLLDKMPGKIDDKFKNLRTFNMFMFAHPGKKLNFMGNEYGQFKEWNYQEGLEFFMLDFERHNQLQKFNKKLNNIYRNNPAFYEIEDSWDGFEWVSTEEKDNNIIAFIRKDRSGREILAIFNFSGNDYKKYRCGADKGEYRLLLSTDDICYGGTGILTHKTYKTVKKFAHNKENSIMINLPAFAGAYFIKK